MSDSFLKGCAVLTLEKKKKKNPGTTTREGKGRQQRGGDDGHGKNRRNPTRPPAADEAPLASGGLHGLAPGEGLAS